MDGWMVRLVTFYLINKFSKKKTSQKFVNLFCKL